MNLTDILSAWPEDERDRKRTRTPVIRLQAERP
jgi:hypothetical protein